MDKRVIIISSLIGVFILLAILVIVISPQKETVKERSSSSSFNSSALQVQSMQSSSSRVHRGEKVTIRTTIKNTAAQSFSNVTLSVVDEVGNSNQKTVHFKADEEKTIEFEMTTNAQSPKSTTTFTLSVGDEQRSDVEVALDEVTYIDCSASNTCGEDSQTTTEDIPSNESFVIYLSPDGNDLYTGMISSPNGTDGPFKTLERARDYLRTLDKESFTKTRYVLLRGGTYTRTTPFVLEPQDSGTAQSPIIYQSYPGEEAIISGGKEIKGWQKEGALWKVSLPEVAAGTWYFNELFVNEERRIRARSPNEGYYYTESPYSNTTVDFYFKEEDISSFTGLNDVLVVLYHYWTSSYHSINTIDFEKQIVHLDGKVGAFLYTILHKNQRYYLENSRDFLDRPGEWFLDRKGVLYYYPFPNEHLETVHSVAPVVNRTIINFKGRPSEGEFIEYIKFQDLSIKYVDALLGRGMINSGQAAHIQEGAIAATGLRNSSITRCKIAHIGEYAIWLHAGSSYNVIEQCHLYDLGAGGIKVGEYTTQNDALAVHHNRINNNYIHRATIIFPGAVGIWLGKTSYNLVTHNEISDIAYSGISVGWSWEFTPSTAYNNTIAYNYVHDYGLGVLSDLGGIYTLGPSPGTTIENNVVHDSTSYSYGGFGLYNDASSSYVTSRNNLVYNTLTAGYHINYGTYNVLENNIFAFTGEGGLDRGNVIDDHFLTATHNIIYSDKPGMVSGHWTPGTFTLQKNIYWSTTGNLDFLGDSLAEWQAKGHDSDSISVNPLFKNPSHYDFSLPENVPGLLGFKPFSTKDVGLYGDTSWIALPSHFSSRAVEKSNMLQDYQWRRDTFEYNELGSLPRESYVGGADKGASIRVSNEQFLSGSKSLKVIDVNGLPANYLPTLTYSMQKNTAGKFLVSMAMFNPNTTSSDIRLDVRENVNGTFTLGPSLLFTKTGLLKENGTAPVLMTLPLDSWVEFEMHFTLGPESKPIYELRVTPLGSSTSIFTLPYQNAAFSELNWVGVMSTVNASATFYLDDIQIGPESAFSS